MRFGNKARRGGGPGPHPCASGRFRVHTCAWLHAPLTRDVEGRGAPACQRATGFRSFCVWVRLACRWSLDSLVRTRCALLVTTRTRRRVCVCACVWATNDIITKVKAKHAESENRQKKNTKQHKNNTETGDKHLRFCAGSQIRMRTLLLFFFLSFTRTRTCVLHGVHDSKPSRF